MRIFTQYFVALAIFLLIKVNAQSQQLPCLKEATYGCLNLLQPISGIQIDTDSLNGKPRRYRYGATANSPVDYNAGDSSCSNTGDSLYFMVTYPSNYDYDNDSCSLLPCIILFHPGGFKEGPTAKPFRKYAEAFAERGYVAFNVEYRSGWDEDSTSPSYNSTGQLIASYRAYQDIRGALKSIVKMKDDGIFSHFNFDLNKLYIGGASAGAFMCINVAYINQNEINDVAPKFDSLLGNLNSPLAGKYYGSGTPLPSIKGVMSLWGAGPGLPGTTPSFIKGSNLPPFIAFHGELDSVAPFDRRDEFYCDDSSAFDEYAAITQCSDSLLALHYDIRDYDNDAASDITTFGGYGIYKRLKQLNVPAEIYLDSNMGHGLDDSTSNFGLATSDNNTVISYMVGRAATFFQAVANQPDTFAYTRFEDCVNTRKGCDPEPANPCASSRPGKSVPVVSVGQENFSHELKISPNPASAYLRIEMQNRETMSGIRVYNLQGQLLLQKKPGSYLSVIRRSEISSSTGVCIVEISTATQIIRKKVVLVN